MSFKLIGAFKVPADVRVKDFAATFGGKGTYRLTKARECWAPFVAEYGQELCGHEFRITSNWLPHERAIGFDVVVSALAGDVFFHDDEFLAWCDRRATNRAKMTNENSQKLVSEPLASDGTPPNLGDDRSAGCGGMNVDEPAKQHDLTPSARSTFASDEADDLTSASVRSSFGDPAPRSPAEPEAEGAGTEEEVIPGHSKLIDSANSLAAVGTPTLSSQDESGLELHPEAGLKEQCPSDTGNPRKVPNPLGPKNGPLALPPRNLKSNHRIETRVESLQNVYVIRTEPGAFAVLAEGITLCEGGEVPLDDYEIGEATLEGVEIVRDLELVKQLKLSSFPE